MARRARLRIVHGRPSVIVRWSTALAAFALLLAACTPASDDATEDDPRTVVIEEDEAAPDQEPSETGSPTGAPDEPDEPAEPTEQPSPSEPESPSESEPAEGAGESSPGGSDTSPGAVVTDDRGPLGSACRPYLRGDVPALTVEVLHQRGAQPSSEAVDHLVSSLRPVLDKPGGIDLVGPTEIPGGGRTWELDQLRELSQRHRQVTSSESRAGMLVLSVAGEFEDPDVLGLAMSATEIVLFPEQIGDLATGLLGGGARIERSVLLHEAGHLLCLVNTTYESEIDHEDPDHPSHSRHRDSVMFWAVPNDAVTQVFTGPPPDRFHEDDLADLRGLREGRY